MAVHSSSAFRRELAARGCDSSGRRWLFVPYDQLSAAIGPLSREDPAELGIVLIESPWKAARRPYHRQKLALVLANLRHFALEQAARGVAVEHRVARGSYGDALREVAADKGVLRCQRPAERELRVDLAPLVREGLVELVPHEGWLTTTEQFRVSQRGKTPWRMEAFYRHVRREDGWLMDAEGKPLGGKLSFDADNREPWHGDPPPTPPPTFRADEVTTEVAELVSHRFAEHPGEIDLASLPATARQATSLWSWAKRHCMPLFGPYEDAMSTRSRTLFHTRVSALVHLHRLLPRTLVEDACALDIELRCKEGFVRQVLGWREFMRHVHGETDGFRRLPPELGEVGSPPSFLGAANALPPAFWGRDSGLACLDEVIHGVWDEAYSHHITRLMVLSNLATLLDVSPRELTDWFWVAYTDAYDWVVEPNVLAMGTFGVGDLLTTKPYVSGAAYLNRMSDYCASCAFDPKKTCPVTPLYWAFLERHREQLGGNPRLRMPYASLRKRAPERRDADARVFRCASERLAEGHPLTPADVEAAAAL
ncbi:MAG: cryptochrome/photolyase family protein [Planctomycetota bacterium]